MKFTKLLKVISEDNGDTKKAIEKLHDQQEEIAKNLKVKYGYCSRIKGRRFK
jgi:hypothetical protein